MDGDGETTETLTMFDQDNFLVDGTMERGCKPLLTIQFAPSSKNQRNLWDGAPFTEMLVQGNISVAEGRRDNYIGAFPSPNITLTFWDVNRWI